MAQKLAAMPGIEPGSVHYHWKNLVAEDIQCSECTLYNYAATTPHRLNSCHEVGYSVPPLLSSH